MEIRQLIRKASIKVLPIIYDECNNLNIPYPKINWHSYIINPNNDEIAGAYINKKRTIILNINIFNIMIKEGLNTKEVIEGIKFLYLHEFKHYIDHIYYGISNKEYISNKEKFEKVASNYADNLLKKVK